MLGFTKMHQLVAAHDVGLIFAHTAPEIRGQLEKNGIREKGDGAVRWFEGLDRAVEWCEDRILLAKGFAIEEPRLPGARIRTPFEYPRHV